MIMYTHIPTYSSIHPYMYTCIHTCNVAPGGTAPALIGLGDDGAPQRPTVNTSPHTDTYACTNLRPGESGDAIGYILHAYIITSMKSCSTYPHMHTRITCV